MKNQEYTAARRHDPAHQAEQPDVEILGKTGQTVIYVFPSGNAQVKRGQVPSEHRESQPKTESPSPASSTSPAQLAIPAHTTPTQIVPVQTVPIQTASLAQPAPGSQSQLNYQVHHQPESQTQSPANAIEQPVQAGLLSAVQKEVVQYDQAATGMAIEEILVARGWFNEATMAAFLN
ncbi:MAG: hypothetical protein ACTS2F_05900 [Thainema sp.]